LPAQGLATYTPFVASASRLATSHGRPKTKQQACNNLKQATTINMPIRLAILLSFSLSLTAAAWTTSRVHKQARIRNARYSTATLLQEVVVDAQSSIHTDPSVLETLAGNVGLCLVQSDKKRNKSNDGASTGWTNWCVQVLLKVL
jgi:hypothetical protein